MQFIDIHTHQFLKKESIISIQSFSVTQNLLALPIDELISVGLHPWDASVENFEQQFKRLVNFAKQVNVKMIGECGLDKIKGAKLKDQIWILEQQIALAESLNKPLILHCVKSFSELIEIKARLKVKVPMIIHGFNKSQESGRQLLDKGFILSFGKAILNSNSGAAKLVVSTDHFFLETDDAETPIEEIYKAAANLKKCSIDELKARIFADWNKLNLH